MLPTRSLRVAVLALAVVAIACGDPTRPKAIYPNALSSYALNALTGAPASAATAINFIGGATRADARFQFDVAFDLDANGKVVLLPVRVVGGALAGALAGSLKRVGLQVVPGSFESLRVAPETGYDTLSTPAVTPGTVVAVEMLDFDICLNSLGGQTLYAKFVVDSVQAATRRVFVRAVVDPNCGYRSVVPDSIPEV